MKLRSLLTRLRQWLCDHPHHHPGGYQALEPQGRYVHECPGCGKATAFVTAARR